MLKVGDKSKFRWSNGNITYGKVVAVLKSGVYLVLGDTICATYADGLFRFTDDNVVRN